jgi:hypothetical protein
MVEDDDLCDGVVVQQVRGRDHGGGGMSTDNSTSTDVAETFTGVVTTLHVNGFPFHGRADQNETSTKVLEAVVNLLNAELSCGSEAPILVRDADRQSLRYTIEQSVRCGKGWRHKKDYVSESRGTFAEDSSFEDKVTLRALAAILSTTQRYHANVQHAIGSRKITFRTIMFGPDQKTTTRYAIEVPQIAEGALMSVLGKDMHQRSYMCEAWKKRKHKVTHVLPASAIVDMQNQGLDTNNCASARLLVSTTVMFILGQALCNEITDLIREIETEIAENADKEQVLSMIRYRTCAQELAHTLSGIREVTMTTAQVAEVNKLVVEMRGLRQRHGIEVVFATPGMHNLIQ